MRQKADALGGSVLTRPFMALSALFALSLVLLAWRFWSGLGGPTALNDGYPWGLWIAFDVVTGTALGCGGYAMAILVYVFNRGQYHPLVRPALVTSALGYTLGGMAIVIDVGRYWYLYKVPFSPNYWNLDSILLEVALCIMLYTLVLWEELSPAFLEKWRDSSNSDLRRIAAKLTPMINESLVWIIALGLLLPTMHQSSLGSLMLLAGPKLHPLWRTPLLPLLFLVSAIAMGYGMVIIESALAGRIFGRPRHRRMLASLAPFFVVLLLLFAAVRVGDVVLRGEWPLFFALDRYTFWFVLETALFVVPAFMLMSKRRRSIEHLFRAAMLVVLAGGVYRFTTYLIAFDPGAGWKYFPSVAEIMVSIGMVAFLVMAYLLIVKKFPILAAAAPPVSRQQEVIP